MRCVAAVPFLLAGLLAAGTTPVPAEEKKETPPEQMTADETVLLDLTNKARVAEGLMPLAYNPKLQLAARQQATNMARQDKLEHVLDGKTPGMRVEAAGYAFSKVGENIAWSDAHDLPLIFKGWMDSPAHRANILKKEFKEVGIAQAKNQKGEWYFAQVFGTPR